MARAGGVLNDGRLFGIKFPPSNAIDYLAKATSGRISQHAPDSLADGFLFLSSQRAKHCSQWKLYL